MSRFSLYGRYPQLRMRRNRRYPWSRRLVAETGLSTSDLIYPLFVIEGENKRESVPSMPNVEKLSIDLLLEMIGQASRLSIPAVILFPCVDKRVKSEDAREAYNPDNLICRAIKAVRSHYPDMGIISDIALDPYNLNGHDGLLVKGEVLNDETVEILCRQALVQAEAGCHILAPSDMMDGRVGAIRTALDESGYSHVQIMSYAAKYASSFYGPFRDMLGTGKILEGDKKGYQMAPANALEALREAALDLEEGADMLIVKPGLLYLDVLHRIKDTFSVPVFAYSVSGEYAMMKSASERAFLDYDQILMESLLSFKRAGADGILTYSALDAARLLQKTDL